MRFNDFTDISELLQSCLLEAKELIKTRFEKMIQRAREDYNSVRIDCKIIQELIDSIFRQSVMEGSTTYTAGSADVRLFLDSGWFLFDAELSSNNLEINMNTEPLFIDCIKGVVLEKGWKEYFYREYFEVSEIAQCC
jgi:hypothetical protein